MKPLITSETHDFIYQGKPIKYEVYHVGSGKHIDTVIFLGTVQIGAMPRYVAEYCPEHTLVVQGAPHWLAKEDGSDIPEFMFGFGKSVFDTLRRKYELRGVTVIADSQAAPGATMLCLRDDYGRHVKKIVLVQPLGLTAPAFGENDAQRIKRFKRRIMLNGYHQIGALLTDSKLRHNHRLLRQTVKLNGPVAAAQYSSGLAHDALPILQKLQAKNREIHIVTGAKDKVFSEHEIREALHRSHLAIPVISIPGVPHSPIGTTYGRKLLRAALDIGK